MNASTRSAMTDGRDRPHFPKRAVVTGGMPYGSKDLHFGHVGGLFVQADVFARFLRDRIGAENVIFVSGTDCYGSPIVVEHREQSRAGGFDGSLEEFVLFNYGRQRDMLGVYDIEPDLFAASSVGRFEEIHRELGGQILETLHANGYLEKRTTPQFYDPEHRTFLNGRQVQGRCPIQGCQSEKAYADECSLGHQFEPADLIDPKSVLSGERPEMRDVTNWYLRLADFRKHMESWLNGLRESGAWRPFVVSSLQEHLEPPILHVGRKQREAAEEIAHLLPHHERREGRGKTLQLVFSNLEDRDRARGILGENDVLSRSGKTLVPFRLTGNLEWGLAAPELEGLADLTFWVWPESLWAPISFTAALLESRGEPKEHWRAWWSSRESQVYQFIGEDNIFFYGLPEAAIFLGMQGQEPIGDPPDGELQLPHLVANRHILFLDKKASSSGAVKPPSAGELLDHYTADQLRAHFTSLGLGMRSVGFRPKPLNPKAGEKEADPVLKEGNLLSNAFNRAVRSCFYTAQKFYDGRVPVGEVDSAVVECSETAILDFEGAMYRHEFHQAMAIVGGYISGINRRWSQDNPFYDDCDPTMRHQALIDAFHGVRVAAVLVHPIAPEGTEKIREYLNVDRALWSWEHIFEPLYTFMEDPDQHRLRFLEPRVDFFAKHPSQVREK
jgi:methionyl-tRNA synthetase